MGTPIRPECARRERHHGPRTAQGPPDVRLRCAPGRTSRTRLHNGLGAAVGYSFVQSDVDQSSEYLCPQRPRGRISEQRLLPRPRSLLGEGRFSRLIDDWGMGPHLLSGAPAGHPMPTASGSPTSPARHPHTRSLGSVVVPAVLAAACSIRVNAHARAGSKTSRLIRASGHFPSLPTATADLMAVSPGPDSAAANSSLTDQRARPSPWTTYGERS